jgi:hypothetical protein
MEKVRRAHRDLDFAAECLMAALRGKAAGDDDAEEVGAQLLAEAVMALVGFQLPDSER